MNIHTHYIKFVQLLVVVGMTFTVSLRHGGATPPTHSAGGTNELNPLLELLHSIPQEPTYPQMQALTISYANYRAVERANGVPNPANRDEYAVMDDTVRAWWQTSLLRITAGPPGFVNLTQDKIETMPELVGFDYFDMDQALNYGAAPYIGTLVRSDAPAFDWARTSDALSARDYDPRRSAAGIAWGRGGDGQTDLDAIALGDPFGGDVGLASRVAVLDSTTVANAFLWGILLATADAYEGDVPAIADMPEYRVMAQALRPNQGELLQAFILNQDAGRNQQVQDVPDPDRTHLPPYVLAAAADLQVEETQVHRVVVVYRTPAQANRAAERISALITAFDNGWLQTIGFTESAPTVRQMNGLYVVTYDIAAPTPAPQDVFNGAFQPGLVFGFWSTAIRQGNFFPLALPAG